MAIDTDRPIVLVGPLRSGTTFLGLMLRQHPRLHFFGEFEEGFHLVEQMESGWPDPDAYRDWLSTFRVARSRGLLPDPSLNYPDQARSLAEQMAAQAEASAALLGFTVHTGFHRVPDVWPNARFIHLLRDPRDVARSCIGMGWVGNVYEGANYWTGPENRWDTLRARINDDQFIELRYEDLVADPESELRRLCTFIDIEYDPAMLEYDAHTTYSKPDPSLAEQWKRKQSPREIQLVEHRVGGLLAQRGYEPSGHPPHRPGAAERARLHIENRARRLAFSIRRYGLPLWVQWQLSRRLPIPAYRRSVLLRVNAVQEKHLR